MLVLETEFKPPAQLQLRDVERVFAQSVAEWIKWVDWTTRNTQRKCMVVFVYADEDVEVALSS